MLVVCLSQLLKSTSTPRLLIVRKLGRGKLMHVLVNDSRLFYSSTVWPSQDSTGVVHQYVTFIDQVQLEIVSDLDFSTTQPRSLNKS